LNSPAPDASRDPARFIRAWTRIESPALIPELRLHLAGPVTPLWEATEKTLNETGLAPPYWAFAWPGGQAIARHLLDHPATVRGRRVLDFAAGGGIAGIAAARAGAASVVASDLDPLALTAITLNAALNGVDVATTDRDLTQDMPAADVILAGDVCYERPMAERVIPWLRGLAGQGVTVLMGDPGRAYLPHQGLVEVAHYAVPTSKELEDRELRETRVLRLLP